MKKTFLSVSLASLISLILLLSLSSCLAPAASKRYVTVSGATSDATPTVVESPLATPTSEMGSANYLQDGSTKTLAVLHLNYDYQDSFYLRGPEINNYLSSEKERSSALCLIQIFLVPKKILLLSANPKFFHNFNDGSREYYFQMISSDEGYNKNICMKSELINMLIAPTPMANSSVSGYAGYQLVYQVADLCPNSSCKGTIFSLPLFLTTSAGSELKKLHLSHLGLGIKSNKEAEDRSVKSCNSSNECKASGFDCCLDGQCVSDKQLRYNVDKSSAEYLQAQQDILANPINVLNYPRLYFICSQSISPTPSPASTPINVVSFEELEELYKCSRPEEESELAICTMKYERIATPRADFTAKPGPFLTGTDDRNFKDVYMGSAGDKLNPHSIVEILYAGASIYNYKTPIPSATVAVIEIDSNNDNLTDAQQLRILKNNSRAHLDDSLKIRYKIDGSCEEVGTSLARCYRYYKQGQNLGKINDHLASNTKFVLPYYADLSRQIVVEVDGQQMFEGYHWQRGEESVKYIEITPYNEETRMGLDVFDEQLVKIAFYVNTSLYSVLNQKRAASDKIASYCKCAEKTCYLKPQYAISDGKQIIENYICDYPTPFAGDIPLEQKVDMSTKNVPVRYYDSAGLSFDIYDPRTPLPEQEGRRFEYVKAKLNRPSNVFNSSEQTVLADIGFNEIYGSFDFTHSNSAFPAKAIRLRPGKIYDIFVNYFGNFSPCPSCGNDYYSTINKILPDNFQFGGSGYVPDPTRTDRKGEPNRQQGNYRADDLLFGRACFVPAAMIPWSHKKRSTVADQRKYRMQGQHLLFANGYQRDWYGFDYGALIGSFDGYTWFAVGSQRRVRAKSNLLFLAINAYYGDLTTRSNISLTVSESGGNLSSGSMIITDYDNDGAECQKYHLCVSDADCITKLGWDYSCQEVNDIRSKVPLFDQNGKEMANAERSMRLVETLVGGFKGDTKRCVYRGRGAPCESRYASIVEGASTFLSSNKPGLLACMNNYYCKDFLDESGSLEGVFNRRIARYAVAPFDQNAGDTPEEFGLGARILGRPYKYNGDETVDSEIYSQLRYNNVKSLCLPGRDVTDGNLSFEQQHRAAPNASFKGDKILNIGMSQTTTSGLAHSLSSCAILDKEGNYINNQSEYADTKLNDEFVKRLAGSQAFSTNVLSIFQGLKPEFDLLIESSETIGKDQILQENRCLRAAGSPCFSNFDCAPSDFISSILSGIDWKSSYATTLSESEFKLWRETLTCGQMYPKGSPEYDLTKNRCCRVVGQEITFDNELLNGAAKLPGVDVGISSPTRYSRIAPAYFSLAHPDPVLRRILEVPQGVNADACPVDFTEAGCPEPPSAIGSPPAFLTIHKILGSTSCSGHWVREFHEDNGGGHDWGSASSISEKKQAIEFANFKCLGWFPYANQSSNGAAFECEDSTLGSCNAYELNEREKLILSDFMGSLELLGIPQVLIKSAHSTVRSIRGPSDSVACMVNPADDTIDARPASNITDNISDIPIPGTVLRAETTTVEAGVTRAKYEAREVVGNKVIPYFSAGDITNFDQSFGLKMIFSPDKFASCLPTGVVYRGMNISNEMCCSGRVFKERCCLGDFADVSVFLNRYVSSEASSLDPSLFDYKTGTLNPGAVRQIAMLNRICCSDVLGNIGGNAYKTGTAVMPLPVPGDSDPDHSAIEVRMRFGYLSGDANVARFEEEKSRWNTHIYCIPGGTSN
ncbi:MAG: hypothetical protein HQK50_04880 [Oligoflexia bacterium]|nr:hypothetical protein [Oligoflexia bacterium]MBF0364881.1 hypothetical protein [Oligoflexia bacterium]